MTFSKRVAIIGGGAAGLVQVKALNQEPLKPEIDVYEARSTLGGVWNYNMNKERYFSEEKLKADKEYNYSAVYDGLETNVLSEVMQFNEFPFSKKDIDFPSRAEVLEYLLRFAGTVGTHNLYLNTLVESISKEDDTWTLKSQNLVTGETNTKTYDAIVVASGHYDVPAFPDTQGLDEWQKVDPESVIHAKFYDKASAYKDKKVLIIGAFASGTDIALQLSATAKEVVVSAITNPTLSRLENPYITQVGKVDSYDVKTRSAKIGDLVVRDIDSIIVCTGYKYVIPFWQTDIAKDRYISDLYQHIFYTKDPTISFLGLVRDVSPLPCTEAQAAVVARSVTGRLKLPSQEEMQQWVDKLIEEKGADVHRVPFPEEAEYINGLHDWLKDSGALDGYQFQRLEGERYARRDINFKVKFERVFARNETTVKKRVSSE